MDENSNSCNSNISIFNPKSGGNSNSNSNQISSLVLDHLFSSSSSISSVLAAAVATSVGSPRVCDAARLASRRVLPSGFDPTALVPSGRPAPEVDVDGYDCDSEDGVDVVDVPVKPSGRRSSGGSKRSRAAEVHNLSEKRRRSRINEKMKALQSLIPNSNKTDKASMLDEAIEYLKQLQLQVQMLSMRNGLSLSPAFLPGDFPAMQSSSEMRLRFGVGNEPEMNGVPISRESLIQESLNPTNQCTSSLRSQTSHESDIKDSMLAFTAGSYLAQPSNVQHGSFGVSVNPLEIYAKGTTPHPQFLGAFHMTRPEPHVRRLNAAVPHGCSSVDPEGGETTESKFPV